MSRTLQRIAGLEGRLTSMQSLLVSKSAVVHSLINCSPLANGLEPGGSGWIDNSEEFLFQRLYHRIIDQLDVFLIDQKVKEAIKALQQGEDLCQAHLKDTPAHRVKDFQRNLLEIRSKLVNQLLGTTNKISLHCKSVRIAIAALNQLGEGVMGHDLLLNLCHKKIKAGAKHLCPSRSLFGGLYTAGLSQSVFSGIVQAVKGTLAIFGDNTELASKLVLWAYKETSDFVALLKKHVVLVTYGLKAMVECVRIAYGHCLLVESFGLTLCPFLIQSLRPTISCILQRNIDNIQETVLSLTAADYWALKLESTFEAVTTKQVSQKTLCRSVANKRLFFFEPPEKLSSSAYHLDMLAMKFASEIAPLSKMHMEGVLMDNLASLFSFYMHLLLKSLTACYGSSNTARGHVSLQSAESLDQQITILVNASVLVQHRFPCALYMALTGEEPSVKDGDFTQVLTVYRPRLKWVLTEIQNLVSKFQTEQFLKEFSSILNSDVYTNLRCGNGKGPVLSRKWRPSAFFEELIVKLNMIIQSAKKVITGWEKMVSLPLLNITKGVMLWLKHFDRFWAGFGDHNNYLKPEGCVQFVFDLHFVAQFASNGDFSSKFLRSIVSDLIFLVQDIYAGNDSEFQSIMPPDEWFVRETQRALQEIILERRLDYAADAECSEADTSVTQAM